MKCLFVFLLAFLPVLLYAQQQDNKVNIDSLKTFLAQHHLLVRKKNEVAQIDSLLQYLAYKDKFMGSVTICQNGRLTYSKAFGYAIMNDTLSKKATTETKYRIGGITQTFTAAMFTKLCSLGKIDDYWWLSDLYPSMSNFSSLSLYHLLYHQSGIHDFTNDSLYFSYYTRHGSIKEMVRFIAKYPLDFAPSTQTKYSNSNYVILGDILEKITHKSYDDNLQEIICQKIGLPNTYYSEKIDPDRGESYSYTHHSGYWQPEPETNLSLYHGAGAIVTTSDDLALFMHHLFQHKLFPQSCLDRMIDIRDGYGEGIQTVPFYDRIGYGYSGHIDGFRSVVCHFPDDTLTVAICSNAVNYTFNDILTGILSLYYGKPYPFPTFDVINVPIDVLKSYEGVYVKKGFPLQLDFSVVNNQLTAKATSQPRFILDPVSFSEFRYDAANIHISFIKNSDIMLLKQGKATIKMKKEQQKNNHKKIYR